MKNKELLFKEGVRYRKDVIDALEKGDDAHIKDLIKKGDIIVLQTKKPLTD